MKYKEALMRSVVIVTILVLSVICGLLFQFFYDKYERNAYPKEYEEYVEKYASQYGVPESVVYAVIKTESGYDSGAVSEAGAVGLMQMMPDTFNWLTTLTKENLDKGLLYDPETNIKYGTYYLSYLYLKYGTWDTVYAAYNAGEGNVDEWLGDSLEADGAKKLNDVPFKETENYIKKVNKAAEIYDRLYYKA
ncbi:MAG: lytic transglycosylase domain-containing protein [Clostridia bacterium]|nr:lytic transglycosylase domain-containing protein [Clostridia bacterium]MBR6650565.1 lytic transglycosylase domain-containing protein [Clostridia bacterium]